MWKEVFLVCVFSQYRMYAHHLENASMRWTPVNLLTSIEHMTSFLKLLLQLALSNISFLYLAMKSPAHAYFLSPTSAQLMSDCFILLVQTQGVIVPSIRSMPAFHAASANTISI